MPIPVTCPSCDSDFKVKDIYAGKRAKCPSCGEPMSIPATSSAKAASPVARPVVASKPKPKPLVDAADEPVRPARKRAADDEDEAPVSPKRKRGASSDDDKPRKKGSALPLILGVVGGVVVLGGGIAVVAILLQPPVQAKATDTTPAPPAGGGGNQPTVPKPDPRNPRVTVENALKIKAGMTFSEVEQMLGVGERAVPNEIADLVQQWDPKDGARFNPRWSGKNTQGFVYRWRNLRDLILVCFSASPTAGGVVQGVIVRSGGIPAEPIELPDSTTPNEKPLEVTAADLTDALKADWDAAVKKYNGKLVKLTGLAAVDSTPTQILMLGERTPNRDGTGSAFSCYFAADQVGKVVVKEKQQVTLVGTVEFTFSGRQLTVKNCRPVTGGR